MADFEKEVKLFMVFDILGDVVRSGPLQWNIKRFRLEDVKNHILDLLLIYRILEKHFPDILDFNKIFDYIVCHDLPEAITGDITGFEGVSSDDKDRVTRIAIEYLDKKFHKIMDFKKIINGYEERVDIEAKVVKMIDKVHSASTFIKYQSEREIDIEDVEILPELRNSSVVVRGIEDGKDVAGIFYDFHIRAVNITDEECEKYAISRDNADKIVETIKRFLVEMYNQRLNGTLLDIEDDFPIEAMQYKRRRIS